MQTKRLLQVAGVLGVLALAACSLGPYGPATDENGLPLAADTTALADST